MQRPEQQPRAAKILLIFCNVILMLAVIFFAVVYSAEVRTEQEKADLDNFCSTVETMKQISVRYLDTELDDARDWAAYIQRENMTEDEALEYLRAVNTRQDRIAHIVDMDTFGARSSYLRKDGDQIETYRKFAGGSDTFSGRIVENLRRLYNGQLAVVGRYRVAETQMTVISVGTRVDLRQEDGSTKGYLLLRVIPVESMRKIWIFPTDDPKAEIGLITADGDYVIPSAAMRSENFLEFIRSYNFADDYNGAEIVRTELEENSSGLMEYRDSKGQDCCWYYSALDGCDGLDILGYLPKSALAGSHNNWPIVLLISGTLIMLAIIDGLYLMSINQQLRETAKLAEQASEAKTQFLSSMSHDIRTPLNAVLGMTELAKSRADDAQYVQECLNKITVSGSHLLTLINDVLDISKVESGKTVLNPAPFAVEELVASMESITRSQADGRGLAFAVELHDAAAPWLMGDKLRLSQVYLNLLNNAVKYTPAGGWVKLEVSETPVEDGKVELVCIVSDNGMGMSEEFQRTMYDSFSRAADSRIDKTQGTGLGLAIAKRMVERMDGTIACRSVLNEGTTFTVRIPLPVTDPADAPHAEALAGAGDLEGTRVLIAEDNDLNWEIIRTMLSDRGIRCDRAENGQVCVDRLEASAPGTYDLVLMDVQMPVLSGHDAARAIRRSARADLRNIPIAAMTADAFAEDVKACLDAGMNAHLAKPVDIEKVLAAIRQLRAAPSEG